jgi:hypothetical protein
VRVPQETGFTAAAQLQASRSHSRK